MAEAAAKEPSMEDILASIRKIIAQDEAKARGGEVSPPQRVAPAPQPQAFQERRAAPIDASTPPSAIRQPPSGAPAPSSFAARMAGAPVGIPAANPAAPPPAPRPASAAPAASKPADFNGRPTSLSTLANQVRSQMPRPESGSAEGQRAGHAQPAPAQSSASRVPLPSDLMARPEGVNRTQSAPAAGLPPAQGLTPAMSPASLHQAVQAAAALARRSEEAAAAPQTSANAAASTPPRAVFPQSLPRQESTAQPVKPQPAPQGTARSGQHDMLSSLQARLTEKPAQAPAPAQNAPAKPTAMAPSGQANGSPAPAERQQQAPLPANARPTASAATAAGNTALEAARQIRAAIAGREEAAASPAQPAQTQQPVIQQAPAQPPALSQPQPQPKPQPAPARQSIDPLEMARAQIAAPPRKPAEAEERAFRDALVSPSTEAAVHGSVDRLRKAVADDTGAKVEAVLRPMLREWLDQHLPAMVERIVREEIERIARA